MKKRIYTLSFILPVVFLLAAASVTTTGVIKEASSTGHSTVAAIFDKIEGTWLRESRKGFERWSKNSDGSFNAIACSIRGNDTVINETVKIYPENEKWVYEVLARGQNQGKTVKFHAVLLTERSVQFSNPAHDFPTDINYTLVAADSLRAFIAGPNRNGGRDTILFRFVRAQ